MSQQSTSPYVSSFLFLTSLNLSMHISVKALIRAILSYKREKQCSEKLKEVYKIHAASTRVNLSDNKGYFLSMKL